jgi:hypothetical protein
MSLLAGVQVWGVWQNHAAGKLAKSRSWQELQNRAAGKLAKSCSWQELQNRAAGKYGKIMQLASLAKSRGWGVVTILASMARADNIVFILKNMWFYTLNDLACINLPNLLLTLETLAKLVKCLPICKKMKLATLVNTVRIAMA